MVADFGVRLFMADVGLCAMAAVHPEKSAVVQGIVLLEMDAVFAGLVFHVDHLGNVVEFITLNVNRVLNSMLCFR